MVGTESVSSLTSEPTKENESTVTNKSNVLIRLSNQRQKVWSIFIPLYQLRYDSDGARAGDITGRKECELPRFTFSDWPGVIKTVLSLAKRESLINSNHRLPLA